MATRVMLAGIPKEPTASQYAYIAANLLIDPVAGKVYKEEQEVGCVDAYGYVKMWIGSRVVKRSHLVWFGAKGVWPSKLVDHKNKDRLDDRIDNLRETTFSNNTINTDGGYKSLSGLPKGVSLDKGSILNPYQVKLFRDKKTVFLGRYPSIEIASEAYCIGVILWEEYPGILAAPLRVMIKQQLETI